MTRHILWIRIYARNRFRSFWILFSGEKLECLNNNVAACRSVSLDQRSRAGKALVVASCRVMLIIVFVGWILIYEPFTQGLCIQQQILSFVVTQSPAAVKPTSVTTQICATLDSRFSLFFCLED